LKISEKSSVPGITVREFYITKTKDLLFIVQASDNQILSTFEFIDEAEVSSELYLKSKANTDNWNTYIDAISNYSIKYPPGWYIKASTADTPEAYDEPVLIGNFDIKDISANLDLEGKLIVVISEENSSKSLTYADFSQNQLTPPGMTVRSQGIVKVGNLDAYRVLGYVSFNEGPLKADYEYVSITIIDPSNTKRYINILAQHKDESFEETLDQILSTFQFVE